MKHRFQSGFSFIEVMIGVVIISVAAYGMVFYVLWLLRKELWMNSLVMWST